jgi:phenylacetate-CoA ligase
MEVSGMIDSKQEGKFAKATGMARAGFDFAKMYHFLGKSQWWSKERLLEYQLKQLKTFLGHAYQNVPYYRKAWEAANFHPDDLKTLDDIRRLPFTTKHIFQENLDALRATNFSSGKLSYVTTGGSTGIPFGFFEEKYHATAREMAFIHRLWRRVGYRVGDKRIVLRGKLIEGADQGRFYIYNPARRELSLSAYHMNDENLPDYIKIIKDFGARYIHAYPSSTTILANYMKKNYLPPFQFIKAILVGSENLYDWQRQLLEDAFQCRIYSWYGHAEKAVLAGECEESNHYHIFPEYGITELIDENGNEVTHEGQVGEIVATGFCNYAMPFIRYRTMDLGVCAANQCTCGRNYPLFRKIEGRWQELIVTDDNRLISMTAINMHNSLFDNVRQFQFYQERRGEVVLNIVKSASYGEHDDYRIKEEIGAKLGSNMRLHLNFVDEIARTKSGKFRFLIQKLPVVHGD